MDCKYLPPLLGFCSSYQMWVQLLLHYNKYAIQNILSLQKSFFDLKPFAVKCICPFLSKVNNVNALLCELNIHKAFGEDAIINKVLSSLPHDFFPFSSTWDNAFDKDKTLLNLLEHLV
jgi:hypothetical protein